MNLSIWSIWEGKKETNDICSNIINNFTNLKEKSTTCEVEKGRGLPRFLIKSAKG